MMFQYHLVIDFGMVTIPGSSCSCISTTYSLAINSSTHTPRRPRPPIPEQPRLDNISPRPVSSDRRTHECWQIKNYLTSTAPPNHTEKRALRALQILFYPSLQVSIPSLGTADRSIHKHLPLHLARWFAPVR